jgi:ABC-type transport system involved in multi-copper enzyme maturation permease subunit
VSILAAVLFWRQREHLSTFIICALAANANLFIFYGVDGKGLPISRVVGVDLAFPLSLLNVLLFFALFSMAVLKTRTSPATAPARLR